MGDERVGNSVDYLEITERDFESRLARRGDVERHTIPISRNRTSANSGYLTYIVREMGGGMVQILTAWGPPSAFS